MACVPALACRVALDQLTAIYPTRSRASDGICGDAAHRARKSDHNSGNAFDITHDPARGVNGNYIAEYLKNKHDSRVKYIIWNRQIWNPLIIDSWREYTGPDPHTGHVHVSINSDKRNDISPWWEGASPQPSPQPVNNQLQGDDLNVNWAATTVQKGSTGQVVKNVQGLLCAANFLVSIDGDFGDVTDAKVHEYQSAAQLERVDGIVGEKTWRALLGWH